MMASSRGCAWLPRLVVLTLGFPGSNAVLLQDAGFEIAFNRREFTVKSLPDSSSAFRWAQSLAGARLVNFLFALLISFFDIVDRLVHIFTLFCEDGIELVQGVRRCLQRLRFAWGAV